MVKPTLVIATRNPGKLREFRRLLADLDARVVSLDEAGVIFSVAEAGRTYHENATQKAVEYADAASHITLADDSGIEVDALDGAPGVMSAVYTGPGQTDAQRTAHLLDLLTDVPAPRRTARYRAVLAIAIPGRGESGCLLFEGTCEGAVAFVPRGDNGFGYDPIFLVPAAGRTMAELSDAQKDAVSHRGTAVRAALEHLKRLLGEYTELDESGISPHD